MHKIIKFQLHEIKIALVNSASPGRRKNLQKIILTGINMMVKPRDNPQETGFCHFVDVEDFAILK